MAEIRVPELAESITEGTIAKWMKQQGEAIAKGETIVELETDKVNVEVISEEEGVVTDLLFGEGDTVEVGQVIARVGAGAGTPGAPSEQAKREEPKAEPAAQAKEPSAQKAEPAAQPAAPQAEEPAASEERPIASPAARKMAREKGIDLSAVRTVDPMGRVRVQDVEAHGSASQATPAAAPAPAPAPAENNRVVREKMSRRRQTIASRLLDVRQNTAMLTTFNEIDMTNVMALRARKKDAFLEKNGVKLGFMSFFTKAVVAALKAYPYVNAQIDGTDLLMNQFYDIGIAVSTEDGLVVPIVRDADRKNFAEVERAIGDLAKKARDKKLALSDLQGGSFTITNGGVFGSLMSTPILNGSQAAILGMHSIVKRPIAIGEDIEIRPMMYVALSYDHRIIDGKDSVGFLKMVKDLLENPEDLMLES